MSEINTIDSLGDNVAVAKLIDKSIDEFIDDEVTVVGNSAFRICTQLTYFSFPEATSVGDFAFYQCSQLMSVYLPKITSIGSATFNGCSQLTSVILGNTTQVATLSNTDSFSNAPNAIIYVPDALVDSYKSATNWSAYASRIKPISELPT